MRMKTGILSHHWLRRPRNQLLKLSLRFSSTYVSDNISVSFANKYDSKTIESGKYEKWEAAGYFQPKHDISKGVFSMILPPPNITGTLHLGHALTATVQDILCRWKRMQGYSVVWVPGTDHAGIATQVIVEKNMRGKTGKTRNDIGREKFLELVSEWKIEKMEKINSQLKQLGVSVDWSRYVFTMDARQSEAVTDAIIRMFDGGLLYRKNMLVNWSCYLQSTISDYEIDLINLEKPTRIAVPGYEEPIEFGTIVDLAYKVMDSDEELVVSTTRPETVFGDVAVAVHPSDQRYTHLRGAKLKNPLNESLIPIVFDEAANPEYGTGAVKITPGHSKIDYEIGQRHCLPVVSILTESGLLNEHCGDFANVPRFVAKQKVLTKLSEIGSLKEVRHHEMQLPVCSRSGDVIEQILKPQWFVKCDKLAERAIKAAEDGDLVIEPEKHKDTYFRWLNNCQDWCISRQLWWGHRLPLYNTDSGWVAAKSEDEARATAKIKFNRECEKIERDEDVLDTWFSSALLPFSVFGWPQTGDDYRSFYPLSLLETGLDIFNFWVVRMVMLGLHFTDSVPFKKVLLHGMVTDSRGRKMSKSLGNVIEFDNIINGITLKELHNSVKANHQAGLLSAAELKYALVFQKELFPKGLTPCGTDALRLTLASLESKDQVIHFNPYVCSDNTKFCNKIWQAAKFIIGWSTHLSVNAELVSKPLFSWQHWLLHRLSQTVKIVDDAFEGTDFHMASAGLKRFFLNDLCDVYLELAKPVLKAGTENEAKVTCQIMLYCLENWLRLMSPVMPFITDELYSYLPGHDSKPVWGTAYPRPEEYRLWDNEDLDHKMFLVQEVVSCARGLVQILRCPRPETEVIVASEVNDFLAEYKSVMHTLMRCKAVEIRSTVPAQTQGPISTVGNEALVYLAVPNFSNEQIVANFGLLKPQIDRPRALANERLQLSVVTKNRSEQLKNMVDEWRHFEREVDEFYEGVKASQVPTLEDLTKMTKFISKTLVFGSRIKTTIKAL